ncbi:Outer membrane lipoprotein LptE/RlpB (LPS assembly) [Mariprofundus ferrinatatus]|uniref:Outer membrane lipoprotein LptE/RlpB (LPS assembly) n=1 Tax=Mariprofundus ferrinatatus TaxID=1921087 RepID=A0A2K8L1K0_9PROT|nr:adenosylmethionine-8-amino-7-oxononanoate aminotransferase [Mariprofundus ferrinatatus]ATX81123.1 Outer membrane lipoprotein LptE/RlpB (LPS assembly) [Mariprofundus ferrinatatus]
MKRLIACAAMVGALLLSGCGYHLVGHGDGIGAIPADVRTVSLIVRGSSDRQLEPMLRQRLKSDSYALIEPQDVIDQEAHANLHVNMSRLIFTPSAYDAAGVETEYRMVFSGSLMLEREGKAIWQSGVIRSHGDVYVAGGPASIEASRERLYDDLRKQWLQDALGRLRSGF